ncbi:Nramp family divalent metal transporter [Carboxydocella sp. ULO1]|uniref:Nramp family divalent metal transporter n=1 Tax=Carboxydocella sp. ULO1 TaxID=1926599 RepID=UPI0009AEC3EC|nr:Nramp family divalent metal transporter [Carboxydocella sp. ULO1]GAW29261.1 manganese transport protein [Carboxydocella sp. ULO1]
MKTATYLAAVPARRSWLSSLGPAVVVAVAYVDPGNFAANLEGGARFGYSLLWVLLLSNLMAIFLQRQSAKLGIGAGKDLATLCGEQFRPGVNRLLWLLAVIAAMATDLAEFLGAALGFYLLLGVPLWLAGLLTAVVTVSILALERYGQRLLEIVIGTIVALIGFCYVIELFLAKPDWPQVLAHTVIPRLPAGSILVAVAMLGATVMPHVVFLHSQLVLYRRPQGASAAFLRQLFRWECRDIALAMNTAFFINWAMVVVAAAVFHRQEIAVNSLTGAYHSLQPMLGSLAQLVFGIALLASGLSSSVVGTMSGQLVLKGFIGLDLPVTWRRLLVMGPALAVLLWAADPLQALVFSQAVLSFALPGAIVPLLLLTRRRDLLGELADRPWEQLLGWSVVTVVLAFNGILLLSGFGG